MNKTAAALLIALTGPLAAAQATSPNTRVTNPAIIKSIDAQAVAYTGRHCGPKVQTQPPRPTEPAAFEFVIAGMDAALKKLVSKDKFVIFKSQSNDKNLYLVLMSDSLGAKAGFVAVFLDQDVLYMYSCDLK